MSDRYGDRYSSYGDERYDSYNDYAGFGNRGGNDGYGDGRASRASGAYSDDATQRVGNPYSRNSGNYRSADSFGAGATRASSGAGAYAEGYREGDDAGRQAPRNSGAARRRSAAFEEYYPDEAVETYRRASYGSAAHDASNAAPTHSRYSRSSGQASGPVSGHTAASPHAQGARGSHVAQGGGSHAPQGKYKPKRSNRKRIVIVAAVLVLAVVLVGAGAAWAYLNSIEQNLHKGVDQETLNALEPATATKTALGDAPFYMLLMGVDMSDWRRDDPSYADDQWGRTDSMILARIDPPNKKVSLISIHRDTMIDLGEYGQQKINAAYEFYGPSGAIKAVSTMAGVPISHYATIDFDGFEALVDAVGGVEVNVPMEINDPVMPCHIDAGWQVLNGEKALDLCRSRHAYDDVADDGDVMRAANQRMVIGALVKKILASDLVTIANSVQTLSKYVTTDLALSDIVGLAQIFKDVDPASDIYTAMEPTTSAYINDTWYEFLDEAEWREMISRMDQGLPPVNKTEVDERTGTVLSTGGFNAPVV